MSIASDYSSYDESDGCCNSKLSDFESYNELQKVGRDAHNTLRFLHLRTQGNFL